MSEKEIGVFINEVSEIIDRKGFEIGYDFAYEKLREYPSCDLLVINLAMLLDGALMIHGCSEEIKEKYQKEIEDLYYRAAQSQDRNIKEQAQAHLISKLIDSQNYTQAQEILDTFSKKSYINKDRMQADLYIAKGELAKASQLIEEKLLYSILNDIHFYLLTLMDIAIKEGRMDDAKYIADIDQQTARLFDLWEYHSYIAHFQLYESTKNRIEYLKLLLPILKSLSKKWDINNSPLYQHIKTKKFDHSSITKLQKMFIREIDKDEDIEWLKENSKL